MGDVFESMMPEEHYQSEISDLQCKLDHVESLLVKTMVYVDLFKIYAPNSRKS